MASSDVTKWQTIVSSQNPELLKKAQEELNENPATRDQDIQKFREMVLAEEGLKSPIDDAFLLWFLRARKFNHERAFQLITRYFSVRNEYADICMSYRPSSMLHVMKDNVLELLPHCDQLGRKIIFIRSGHWDPKNSRPEEQICLAGMMLEHALIDEAVQVHGVLTIIDFTGFGLSQAIQMTPSFLKKMVILMQDCVPTRIKGFHILFQPLLFTAIHRIMRPFFSKKLRSRIFLHGDRLESLHEHIHPEYLPKDLGGLLPPIEFSATNEALLAKDDEIADSLANFGYNKD